MTDLEKRAHDIAVRILPRMMKEEKLSYLASYDGINPYFNAEDIIDLYCSVYEDLLRGLQDAGKF